jgi:uncharacterized protein
MLKRAIEKEVLETAKDFKIVCVTGPRQSGKTTLCSGIFTSKPYISLEDPDVAMEAQENPRTFLAQFPEGAILDEVQRIPTLFNYLQGIVDKRKVNGQFVLSGSNNFLMQENISQSLAGRVGYIELLPFSYSELNQNGMEEIDLHNLLLKGSYPDIITRKSSADRWLENYIKTYVERDVRMIKNIGNLNLFHRFLKICAARTAQLVNINSISKEVGVDNKTIESWFSILESSYIVFRLSPYYKNFNKRIVKSSKLYFYDTGVLCTLLGIKSVSSLVKSTFYGAIFENFFITEIKKNRLNREKTGDLYFFRDHVGNEVDLVIESDNKITPIEIKSNNKSSKSDHQNLNWFQKVFRQEGGLLIYSGEETKEFSGEISHIGWKSVSEI